jgi:hypothetical protein
MAPRFLNERLVTTPRFAPREPASAEQNGPVQATAPEPAAAPAERDVRELVRAEHTEIRRSAARKEAAELERLRGELTGRLQEAVARLQQEQQTVQSRLEVLQRQMQNLAGLTPLSNTETEVEALRQWKRQVHGAHMELLKVERNQAEPRDERRLLMSLTFGDLTRLGLGLTWPLIAALLLAAAIVGVGVLVALGV